MSDTILEDLQVIAKGGFGVAEIKNQIIRETFRLRPRHYECKLYFR